MVRTGKAKKCMIISNLSTMLPIYSNHFAFDISQGGEVKVINVNIPPKNYETNISVKRAKIFSMFFVRIRLMTEMIRSSFAQSAQATIHRRRRPKQENPRHCDQSTSLCPNVRIKMFMRTWNEVVEVWRITPMTRKKTTRKSKMHLPIRRVSSP